MTDERPMTDERREAELTREQISLVRRLRQPRTIISLAVPIVLLVLIGRVAVNIDVDRLVAAIVAANWLLLLVALAVYYLGFPLRGGRWALLLRRAGNLVGVPDAKAGEKPGDKGEQGDKPGNQPGGEGGDGDAD